MTTKLMLSGLVGLLSVNLFAAGMAEQSQCFKSVYTKAARQGFLLEDSKLIIVPAEESNKKGFYAYSDKSSYFCQLPNKPNDESELFKFFNLEISVEDKPVQFTYHEAIVKKSSNLANESSADKGPKTTVTSADKDDKSFKYQKIACTAILSDKTKDLLNTQIKNMISTVYETYNRRLSKQISAARKAAIEAGGAIEVKRPDVNFQDYVDALSVCENTTELKDAVKDEIVKFKTIYGSKNVKTGQRTQK